jgi:GH35 family endo-1,4-beta-xylanase
MDFHDVVVQALLAQGMPLDAMAAQGMHVQAMHVQSMSIKQGLIGACKLGLEILSS